MLNRSKKIERPPVESKFQSPEMTPTLKLFEGVRMVIHERVTIFLR